MSLDILTIVLDGMETLPMLFSNINRLDVDWHWHIVEGAAMSLKCTSWCRSQPPRLSMDGTTEYLESLRAHPRIHVYRKPRWEGKLEMVNRPLEEIRFPTTLLQCDADEVWTTCKMEQIEKMFTGSPQLGRMYFWANYFVGPNLITPMEDSYGNNSGEWLRAWRYLPGMRFNRHEPPQLEGNNLGGALSRPETRREGLVFDHYSWAFEGPVAYKEAFYGYTGAVAGWRALQLQSTFPVPLKRFFYWVDDRATVIRTHASLW